ncbi:MAG: hypothetical protein LBJ94_03610 [Puniceicoccales bacterium]|nr:hypothetical protein [Puniceicoccales bacterium]
MSVLNRIDLILRGIGGRNAIASDKESQGKNKHDFATSCKSGRIRNLMAKNAKRSTAAPMERAAINLEVYPHFASSLVILAGS